MYVTPRPDAAEDPLYGMRFAAIGTLAYAAIPLLNPALPPIIAALPLGLIAAQRKAFNHIDAVPAIMIDIPHTSVMRRAESEAGFRTRHIQRFCGQRLVLRPTNRPQSVDCVLINYLQDSRRSWAAAVHLKPGLVFH